MELKNKLFAILAVFCVILSACAVSASDDVLGQGSGDYLDGSEDGHNGTIVPPDNTHDEAQHAAGADPYLDGSEDGHNGTMVPPDANHDEAAMNTPLTLLVETLTQPEMQLQMLQVKTLMQLHNTPCLQPVTQFYSY